MSRAIQKAVRYNENHSFELKMYPTEYFAKHFDKALIWACKEYKGVCQHSQNNEEMKQLSKLRGKLFSATSAVFMRGAAFLNPRFNELFQVANECNLLSAECRQRVLDDFKAQCAPFITVKK
jgi:hypothetical protein